MRADHIEQRGILDRIVPDDLDRGDLSRHSLIDPEHDPIKRLEALTRPGHARVEEPTALKVRGERLCGLMRLDVVGARCLVEGQLLLEALGRDSVGLTLEHDFDPVRAPGPTVAVTAGRCARSSAFSTRVG